MIASICSEPKVLEVMRYVNIFVSIIRIVVPILLIFSLTFKLIKAVTNEDSDGLSKVKKNAPANIIAAVVIFLIPTIISLIVKISFPNSDYKNCLDIKSVEQINQIYEEKTEKLVTLVEETMSIYDYTNAEISLKNIKDEDKRNEYENRLAIVKEQIDELNKTPENELAGTGLGKDIVPQKELIEACRWILHDEDVQIRLATCLPGPYRYPNASEELPGGAIDLANGQASALKTISLFEYQKGVFFGEEDVMAAQNAKYAFMIIYKTVFLHNTVWRIINNGSTYGKFKEIYYQAGNCAQNYRNSLRVARYDSGLYKNEIDDAVNKTRYLVLANEDGTTTDARYYSTSGLEQQIEAAGKKGTDYVEILENVIKSGNELSGFYKNARVYDCRNLIEDGTIESPNGTSSNSVKSNIIFLGDSRIEAYKGIKGALGFNDSTEAIFATSGAKYDERFISNMNGAKSLINSNKGKTYSVTVNYGVNAPGTYRGFCDYYVDFVGGLNTKNKFIIVSVTPFDESKSVYYDPDDRNEKVVEFNNYMKSTCISRIKEKNPNNQVYYCDVYNSLPINEWVSRKYISDDGIHYTTEGSKYIYNYIKKCVALHDK